uniref:Methyltransferase domain-containing protein n=1 Tax=Panagrolaimus davidi TaxID=227884 RepID=A0A914QFK9_9BILA
MTDNKTLKLREMKFKERKRIFNNGGRNYEIYNLLAPEAFCPNLIRIGRLGDGGKWICNPFALLNLNHKYVMYSLGLNNEISFEMELINLTNYSCNHIAIDIVCFFIEDF